jgi:hypothetical protein
MQIKRRGVELRLVIDGNGVCPQGGSRPAESCCPGASLVRRSSVGSSQINARDCGAGSRPEALRASAGPAGLSVPEMVEAIANGNRPPDLSAQALITRRIDLPLEWKAQQTALHV